MINLDPILRTPPLLITAACVGHEIVYFSSRPFRERLDLGQGFYITPLTWDDTLSIFILAWWAALYFAVESRGGSMGRLTKATAALALLGVISATATSFLLKAPESQPLLVTYFKATLFPFCFASFATLFAIARAMVKLEARGRLEDRSAIGTFLLLFLLPFTAWFFRKRIANLIALPRIS